MLWLFCCAAAVDASTGQLQFHHVADQAALPSSWVWSIAEDHDGFVWIGTDAGLARFDGYETRLFRRDADSTLPSSKIRALHVDSKHQLWVGMQAGTISRLQPKGGSFETITFDDPDVNWVHALTQVDDRIVIGTNRGLFQVALDGKQATRAPHSPIVRILSLAAARDTLWIGSSKGILRTDRSLDTEWKAVSTDDDPDQRVFAITVDSDETVWFGLGGRLFAKPPFQSAPTRRIADRFPPSLILSLAALDSGELAIGTVDKGLFLLQPEADQLRAAKHSSTSPANLKDHGIYSLMQGSQGILWVGTFGGGASFASLRSRRFGLNTGSPDCPMDDVSAVIRDAEHRVWIGRAGSVTRLETDGECRQLTRWDSGETLPNFAGLFLDQQHQLWAQLEGQGLGYFDETAQVFVRMPFPELDTATVMSVALADEDGLWLGTAQLGLFHYDQSSGVLRRVADIGGQIYEIHPWEQGLLLATSQGAVNFDHRLGLASMPFRLAEGIEVQTILVDRLGNRVWLGTRSNGLFVADLSTKAVIRVGAEEGFTGDSIRVALQEPGGSIWIGSNNGMFRMAQGGSRFVRYQQRDGFHSDESFVGEYSESAGRILLGGAGGINDFDPNAIIVNPEPPRFAITRLAAPSNWPQQQQLDVGSSLVLDHQSTDFTIEMAALGFDDPQRNRYAYRLHHYDEDWTEVGASRRQVTYTNLAAGRYEFLVRTANKDGVWSGPIKSLDLRIKPAPWLTWWAKVTYVVMAVGAILAAHQIRLRKATRRAEALQREVALRTHDIIHKQSMIEALLAQKNALFESISHEFRTPLTLLSGPLQKLRINADESDQNAIELVERNSNRLLSLVDQLLSAAKADAPMPVALGSQNVDHQLSNLIDRFRDAAADAGIEVRYRPPDESLVVLAETDSIELIVGNLLSNAVKYSPAQTAVDVTVIALGDEARIEVSDRGSGIDETERSLVFQRFFRASNVADRPGDGLGLAVVHDAAMRCGGRVEVDDRPGGGARFYVYLPRVVSPVAKYPASNAEQLLPALELISSDQLSTDPNEQAWTEPADILVVEDDADMREFVCQCLQQLGPNTSVKSAIDGQNGIEQAQQLIPDLIVCDVMMPRQNGYELVRRIRSDQRTSHIPIVLLTALVDEKYRRLGWDENVDDYLGKPFSPGELRARVRSLLAVRRLLQQRNALALELPDADLPLLEKDEQFLSRLDACLEKSFGTIEFGPKQMADHLAMSERQLQRKLKALLNQSPSDYLRDFRLRNATTILQTGKQVGLVAELAGFNSASHFGRCFKAKYGLTPKQFQQRHSGS